MNLLKNLKKNHTEYIKAIIACDKGANIRYTNALKKTLGDLDAKVKKDH